MSLWRIVVELGCCAESRESGNAGFPPPFPWAALFGFCSALTSQESHSGKRCARLSAGRDLMGE